MEPGASQESPSNQHLRNPRPDQPPRRVLVIDDEPLLLRLLCRCLRGSYQVQACEDGAEAIAHLLVDSDYDIILCDLVMPVAGQQVFRLVTEANPVLAPRFVFMSGNDLEPALVQFLGGLTNPHLEKPFEINELLVVLDRMV